MKWSKAVASSRPARMKTTTYSMSATTSSGASNPHTIEVVARRELFRGRVDSPTLFGAENGFSVILNSVGRPTEGFYDTALNEADDI